MRLLLCVLVLVFSLLASKAQQVVPVPTPGAVVSIAWSAPAWTNFLVYNVYYGVTSGSYTNKTMVNTNLTCTISNLTRGSTYYFAITDTDTNGFESDFSNEVNFTPATPPPPPYALRLIIGH